MTPTCVVAMLLILQLCVAWQPQLSSRSHFQAPSPLSMSTGEYTAIRGIEVVAASDGAGKLVGGLWKKDEQALLICFRRFG
jgi:hypothetical protein